MGPSPCEKSFPYMRFSCRSVALAPTCSTRRKATDGIPVNKIQISEGRITSTIASSPHWTADPCSGWHQQVIFWAWSAFHGLATPHAHCTQRPSIRYRPEECGPGERHRAKCSPLPSPRQRCAALALPSSRKTQQCSTQVGTVVHSPSNCPVMAAPQKCCWQSRVTARWHGAGVALQAMGPKPNPATCAPLCRRRPRR